MIDLTKRPGVYFYVFLGVPEPAPLTLTDPALAYSKHTTEREAIERAAELRLEHGVPIRYEHHYVVDVTLEDGVTLPLPPTLPGDPDPPPPAPDPDPVDPADDGPQGDEDLIDWLERITPPSTKAREVFTGPNPIASIKQAALASHGSWLVRRLEGDPDGDGTMQQIGIIWRGIVVLYEWRKRLFLRGDE